MLTYKTITFDNITTQPSAIIPDGFEGFEWIAYDPLYSVYGGEVRVTTGTNSITPSSYSIQGLGFQMKLKQQGIFYVKSAVITALPGFNMDFTVTGRLDNLDIFNREFNSNTGYGEGPTEVQIYCNGVDELTVHSNAAETFAVDNMVFALRIPPEDECGSSNSFFDCLLNCFRRMSG